MMTRRLLLSLFLLLPSFAFGQIATHVVISEVYGGGGNSGATYKNDFIELYNPTGSTVSLSGWAVQYNSATGTGSWFVTPLSGSIAAYSFYLVREAQGAGGTTDVPTPDDSGSITLSATNGKVALTNDATALSGAMPASAAIIDLIGYGTANFFEGAGAAPALTNTTSAERKARSSSTAVDMAGGGADEILGNGVDSDNNAGDFVAQSGINPQNSASSTETPPSGNQGPSIAAVTRSTFVPATGATDSVKATITDPDGTIASAKLHVRVNGGAYDSSFTMSVVSGSLYAAVVSAAKHVSDGDLVEYFISATDDSGAYTSTETDLGGYFVGDAPISSIKAYAVAAVTDYGARISGIINMKTNTFQNGGGFMQDGTGGMQLFVSGGLPSLDAGRNATVEGTVKSFNGAYELSTPNFSFVDTTGSSGLIPTVITLPLSSQSPAHAEEGRLVQINSLTTDSTGTYTASRAYLYENGSLDTITVYIQSNGAANTTVGAAISGSPVNVVGILQYFNSFLELKPRKAEDVGSSAALTFEAVASGNWSNPATWSSGVVPDSTDDVTMTTLGVTVTVDVATARCRHLSMTGSGSAVNSGPLLQFNATGSPKLTVYGDLRILSGGSDTTGTATGDRGGRAKLTSNGNTGSTLVVKGDITTFPSNSPTSGDAGLNMNEGTVKLIGASSDTLRNSAGLRLGNLEIGDGAAVKTMVWRPKSTQDLAIRSLHVRTNGTFWIGNDSSGTTGGVGYFGSDSIPTLTGGITIDAGGALRVLDFASGVNSDYIDLDGGGITNNGTLDLRVGAVNLPGEAAATGCSYIVAVGGNPAGSPSSSQSIGGSQVGSYAEVRIASGHTLTLNQDMNLGFWSMLLDGTLVETAGNTVIGTVTATRVVAQSVPENFGGVGATINAAGAAPDTTTVTRVTGVAQIGGSGSSILRYYSISPQVNSGLNASLDLKYDDSELAGQTAANLDLWKSTDAGASWTLEASSVNTGTRTISASGVNAFSRWTAADDANALGGSTSEYLFSNGWNMISVPLTVANYAKSVLFPSSTSNAFAYTTAYEIRDTLTNGIGYWLKFGSADTVGILGSARTLDTIDVAAGWNLIGALSVNAPVAAIGQIPPSNVVTPYYGYEGSYIATDTLKPSNAYWVKANAVGQLVLNGGGPSKAVPRDQADGLAGLSTLTVRDANGFAQTLYIGSEGASRISPAAYELPPMPPKGSFDARFVSGRSVELYTERAAEVPVAVQATAYPITVTWHVEPADGQALSLRTGAAAATPIRGDGSVTMTQGTPVLVVSGGRSIPKAFALGANYPNPFNPSTRFTVALPVDAAVDVAVYNLLGQRVRTLVTGVQAAGELLVEWDARSDDGSAMASGIYLLRMQSGGFSAVHKMMLTR